MTSTITNWTTWAITAAAGVSLLALSISATVHGRQAPASPSDAAAAQPSTQPQSRDSGMRRGNRQGMMARVFGGQNGGQGQAFPLITPADRDEAAAFLKAHSPNRSALLDQMRPQMRQRMLNMVVLRYRSVKHFQTTDPDLYNLLVQQFEVQDETLGLTEALARVGSDPKARADAEQALRDKITQWITLNLNLRQQRIQRLQKTISDQQQRLDTDIANKDSLIDNALKRAMDDADRLSHRQHPSTAPSSAAPATQPSSAVDAPNPLAANDTQTH